MSVLRAAVLAALICALVTACVGRPAGHDETWPTEIGLLEDPGGLMDIEEAASPESADAFRMEPGNRLSLGFCLSALWVRFSLDQTPSDGPWVLELPSPWLDRVELYLPRPEGGRLRLATGLLNPPARGGADRFVLTAPADTPRHGYAYLRLRARLSLNAALSIRPKAALEAHAVWRAYLLGALYGIMAAMVMVNLLVFITTRDRAYLYYVIYLTSMIFHQFCLQGQVLLLPTTAWPLIPKLSLGVTSVMFFFGAAFCRTFLHAWENAPVCARLLVGVQAATGVLMVLALGGWTYWGTWLAHSMALVGPLVGIAAGLFAFARGFRPARFYLVAWIVLLLGAMAWGAWSMGSQLPLPPYVLTIAAALESILLSLALADRVAGMQRERRVLAQREQRYRRMSVTDELTGLYNARYFWTRLETEVNHALAMGRPLGLVLLDVDDFKHFNDTHGHLEGDRVLAGLGRLLWNAVRPTDSPCRYGGEEFALVLPGSGPKALEQVAERVRAALSVMPFPLQTGQVVTITASLGTALLQPGDDAKSLVGRADRALYQAKALGKNRVVGEEENHPPRPGPSASPK
jgi:diguanylate cyclase (GGDEF)-like protein